MKDLEPLVPTSEKPDGTLPYWGIISQDLDELGLTKSEFRIFAHVLRRAGPPRYVCNAGNRSISRITRTHPDYVRWVIRHLVKRKLLLRVVRPGQSTELRPCDKFAWLERHCRDADAVDTSYEETAGESQTQILWSRLWALVPGAPKARYERKMKDHPSVFESVLAEMENRVARGSNPRFSADRLAPVRDTAGLFEFTWKKYLEANK